MLSHAAFSLSLICSSLAHSWVDDLYNLAADGSVTGIPGYVRGNVPRVLPLATPIPNPAYSDFAMQNLLPLSERLEILPSDHICKPTQQVMNITEYSPMLQATAESRILLRYQENGHVTLREKDDSGKVPRKPSSGTVFVYDTNESTPQDALVGIYGVWTTDGSGGDGRGALLTEAPFDDGKCYQVNNSEESARRQALPQRLHTEKEGRDLWCGVEVLLPSSVVSGTTYTIYWVWSWPTLEDDVEQRWKQEIYIRHA